MFVNAVECGSRRGTMGRNDYTEDLRHRWRLGASGGACGSLPSVSRKRARLHSRQWGGVLLDASPAFTPDATFERLAAYGEAGRQNYSFRNLTVDVLLPLSVFPFLFLLIRRATSRSSLGSSLIRVLLAVPVAYVFLDLLENGSVLALLASYPTRLNGLAATLPYTTVVKRAASILALGVPVAMFASQFIRRKRRTAVSML
jgi:hypothetical protein